MNRAVTSIDWSPAHPELLLTSFSDYKSYTTDEPDGLIHLYSLSLHNKPERVLTC